MFKKFFLSKYFQNKSSRNTDKKRILKIFKKILNENSQTIKSVALLL